MDDSKPKRDRKTKRWAMLGGVVLVSFVGQLLLQPIGDGLTHWSYDTTFLFKGRDIPNELVMVYLDPKIKSNLGQPVDEPLNRRFYVQLLDRLTTEGARLVLFDFLFDTPSPDSAVDEQFAAAMRKNGRVVLVGFLVKQIQGNAATIAPMPPIPVLADAAAAWGLAEISPDVTDYCVRRLDTVSKTTHPPDGRLPRCCVLR